MGGVTNSVFPIPTDGDSRFRYRLLVDVARVLERHGFPPVEATADLVRLQQSLFNFLYAKPENADAEGVLR
ncbi:hypothetical protein JCM9534A_45050 [Catenuloplanes indicus JCM 9534]